MRDAYNYAPRTLGAAVQPRDRRNPAEAYDYEAITPGSEPTFDLKMY